MKRERKIWPVGYPPSNGSSSASSGDKSPLPSSDKGSAPAPLGRPPVYNDTMPERAYTLISRTGMSQEDLAVAFGVTDAAIAQWKGKHPEFFRAINQAYFDFNSGEIVKALATRAKGFTVEEEKIFCNAEGQITRARTRKYYPPDTSAIMYWLNNRRKDEWAYNSRIEVRGKLQTEETGPAAKALAELLKASPIDNIRTFRDSVQQIVEGANGHCQS